MKKITALVITLTLVLGTVFSTVGSAFGPDSSSGQPSSNRPTQPTQSTTATTAKTYSAEFFILYEGLEVPVGTASCPTANYYKAGEGTVTTTSYYNDGNSVDEYITSAPEVELEDGQSVLWYVVKTESEGIHVDGVVVPFTTVVYDGAGATSGTTTDSNHYYKTTATAKDNGFVKDGYTFVGWNTAEDGTGTAYQPGDEIAQTYEENINVVTLYAQWVKNEDLTTAPATEAPTTTEEATEAPTTTEEVTEAPTTTEEPTEAPTTTEEPTEAPTTTEEPTEAPTTTEEPTEAPTTTEEVTEAPTTTEEATTVAPTTEEATTAPATQATIALRVETAKGMAVRMEDGTVAYTNDKINVEVGKEYHFQMCTANQENGIYDDNGNGIAGTVVYTLKVVGQKEFLELKEEALKDTDRYTVKGMDIIDNDTKTIVINKDADNCHLETDVNNFFMAYRFHFTKGDYNKQTGIEGVVNTPVESLSVNLPLGTTVNATAYKNYKAIDSANILVENNVGTGIYYSQYLTSVNDYTWNY